MGLTRGNTEIIKIFTDKVLNVGGLNPINEGFPIGEAIRRFILQLKLAITIGTGAGPIADGDLNFLKALSIKNSRGWVMYNNLSGRPLWILDQIKSRTLGVRTTLAAASATYSQQYNLWFLDPMMLRPEDTILDTSMFNKIQIDLILGTVADLYTTVGTSSVIVTADLLAERIRGKFPVKAKPKEYIEIGIPAPVNPASATEINLERAENLAFKRLLVQAANSAIVGIPFSGTPANTTIAAMGIDSDAGELFNKLPWGMLNTIMKQDQEMEAALPGYVLFDLCGDRSKMSAILSGLYSRLRIFWDNGALSTSQVSVCYEAMKKII